MLIDAERESVDGYVRDAEGGGGVYLTRLAIVYYAWRQQVGGSGQGMIVESRSCLAYCVIALIAVSTNGR